MSAEEHNDTGHESVPTRYSEAGGRETIDLIREALGDAGFLAFCQGTQMKYEARAGKKLYPGLSAEESRAKDLRKAEWYSAMVLHIIDPKRHPDPRSYRQ